VIVRQQEEILFDESLGQGSLSLAVVSNCRRCIVNNSCCASKPFRPSCCLKALFEVAVLYLQPWQKNTIALGCPPLSTLSGFQKRLLPDNR
jgi:hypothetical protein